jgi:hypothetical protein
VNLGKTVVFKMKVCLAVKASENYRNHKRDAALQYYYQCMHWIELISLYIGRPYRSVLVVDGISVQWKYAYSIGMKSRKYGISE